MPGMTTSVNTTSKSRSRVSSSASSPEVARVTEWPSSPSRVSAKCADLVIVLDDQDLGAGLLGDAALLVGLRGDRDAALAARQQQGDGGALAGRAFDRDVAARLGGEAIDLAEAEAGALARLLGGEEGLEDAARRVRRPCRCRCR